MNVWNDGHVWDHGHEPDSFSSCVECHSMGELVLHVENDHAYDLTSVDVGEAPYALRQLHVNLHKWGYGHEHARAGEGAP